MQGSRLAALHSRWQARSSCAMRHPRSPTRIALHVWVKIGPESWARCPQPSTVRRSSRGRWRARPARGKAACATPIRAFPSRGKEYSKTKRRSYPPLRRPAALRRPASVRRNAQDLLGLGQRVDRFLMLACLVQRLAFGAVLLYILHLRSGELRILRQRVVDLLHIHRAMKCEYASREEQSGG